MTLIIWAKNITLGATEIIHWALSFFRWAAPPHSVSSTEVPLWVMDSTFWTNDVILWATDITLWATDVILWATDITLWATDVTLRATNVTLWATDVTPLGYRRHPLSYRRHSPSYKRHSVLLTVPSESFLNLKQRFTSKSKIWPVTDLTNNSPLSVTIFLKSHSSQVANFFDMNTISFSVLIEHFSLNRTVVKTWTLRSLNTHLFLYFKFLAVTSTQLRIRRNNRLFRKL